MGVYIGGQSFVLVNGTVLSRVKGGKRRSSSGGRGILSGG